MLKYKPNVVLAFLVMGSFMLVCSVDVRGQEATNTENTLLDPLSESFDSLPQSVCRHLYCPRYYRLSTLSLDSHDGAIMYSAAASNPNLKPCDSSVYVNCGTSTVLAWQRWKATNMRFSDSTVVWEDHAIVLYQPGGEVDSNAPRWKLLYMMRTKNGTQWHPIKSSEYLNGEPSNAAVYRIVQDWTSEPRRFFSFDRDGIWTRDYNGLHLKLVAGDVREKTWEAVIGEKPTKFFPGEKE